MSKATVEALLKLLGEHYPCKVCKEPGTMYHSKGFYSCDSHREEVDDLARADHEKWVWGLFNAKKWEANTGEAYAGV